MSYHEEGCQCRNCELLNFAGPIIATTIAVGRKMGKKPTVSQFKLKMKNKWIAHAQKVTTFIGHNRWCYGLFLSGDDDHWTALSVVDAKANTPYTLERIPLDAEACWWLVDCLNAASDRPCPCDLYGTSIVELRKDDGRFSGPPPLDGSNN